MRDTAIGRILERGLVCKDAQTSSVAVLFAGVTVGKSPRKELVSCVEARTGDARVLDYALSARFGHLWTTNRSRPVNPATWWHRTDRRGTLGSIGPQFTRVVDASTAPTTD